MEKRGWHALFLTVLMAALVIGQGSGCSRSSGGGSQWPAAVAMMQILPSDAGDFNYTDLTMLPADWWTGDEFKEHYGETYRGQSWAKMHSMAMVDEPETIWLLEGDLDLNKLREALGESGSEEYEYGGTTVWKGNYWDTAIINRIVVTAKEEQLKGCIDAASGEVPSMYDDRSFRWAVDRLPKGTDLAVFPHNWGDDPSLIVQGVARDEREGYHTSADAFVYEFDDAQIAAAQAEEMAAARENAKAEHTTATDFRIEQDGQYVLLIEFPLISPD